jgi:hypothetical protein
VAEYNLNVIIEQRTEAVGGEEVTFTWNEQQFSFPHPLLADDAWKEGLSDVTGDVEFGQYVLGEQYDAFIAAGGRSSYLAILMDNIRKDSEAKDGKGRPTRSSVSSRAPKRPQKRT